MRVVIFMFVFGLIYMAFRLRRVWYEKLTRSTRMSRAKFLVEKERQLGRSDGDIKAIFKTKGWSDSELDSLFS